MNLLVIRNDKIGDFALIWPALKLLKSSLLNLRITALVSDYVAPLASICPYIDEVIVDISLDGRHINPKVTPEQSKKFYKILKAHKFDSSICFYSTWHNTKLVNKLKIPHRFAPATKLFQIFHNHRLRQKRSYNLKPEYEYNLDLARYFLGCVGVSDIQNIEPPYLVLQKNYKEIVLERLGLNSEKPWIFVHVTTGGTAGTLPPSHIAKLIQNILSDFDVQLVLTTGPNEGFKAADVVTYLDKKYLDKVFIYESNYGLVDFVHIISTTSVFIAGSTGPLHIAGLLNIPNIGFFPNFKSSNALRWTVCSSEPNRLSISLSSEQGNDFSKLNIDESYIEIQKFIAHHLILN
ncbi:glycosyltransferase family 9 protein [Taylorella equigenitalis]|uniref:glycosyltransferase family 9 protein n=1 Tax=Taylorella equigenitalis TaxID=29575 RepID=UPI00237CDCE7|nr:glycosyltransferase family 9 protein [Taylorella equigenitalis]WDU54195.1 glycosyltransferase family 9 protein [Taylorella equigenitalis]